jgi:cytochrome c2
MPDFGLNEEQATCLVNALLAGSREHTAAVDAPVAVHFTGSAQKGRDVFSNKCGSCHHLLSEHRGVLGRGNIGPNLSGLLSPHYPKTFRDTGPWTSQALKSWLKTPRAIQQWSRMRPIRLTGDETRELESILQVSPGPGR